MIHYPQQILNFGPLIHTWTMRNEAKLRIIKRAAQVSNFKNVCQTVAKRHQQLLCLYVHSNLLSNLQSMQTGPCKQYLVSTQPMDIQLLLKEQYQCAEESTPTCTTYATFNGTTFKPDACVLLSYDELDPIFGKIITIMKMIVVRRFLSKFYDSHFRAFCISERTDTHHDLCNIKGVVNSIFHLRRTFARDNNMYLTLKYHLEK